MDFLWPARRPDSICTRDSLLIAVSLTVAAGLAVATPLAYSYAVPGEPVVTPVSAAREALTFVRPTAPPVPRPLARPTVTARPRSAPDVAPGSAILPGAPAAAADTGTAPTDSARLAAVPKDVPTARADRAAAPRGPVMSTSAFSTKRELTDAERMELMAEALRRPFHDLKGWRLVPADEREGMQGEVDKRMAEARLYDPARVSGLPGVSVGFLGSGPSREQRTRDSIVHHDNLLRLARLAERARAKRDSSQR
ncbi:MAG: hypothetical protein ACRENU_05025 [Gemmatimonadaceae bacterium]